MLKSEYQINPIGIDAVQPRLSWQIEATRGLSQIYGSDVKSERRIGTVPILRGLKQTAYHILAASSREILDPDKADLWDSGKIESSETSQVNIQASRLKAGCNAGGRCVCGTRMDRHQNGLNLPAGRWACSNRKTGQARNGYL